MLVYTMKRLVLNFIFIQVKSNAVRALGYLSRFIRFNHQANTVNDSRFVEHYVSINLYFLLLLLQLTNFLDFGSQ